MQPQVLGSYQLLEELGRGGMGIVYKALDTTLQRFVAVKVLPSELASEPVIVARFVREARSLARLRHPNLMHIYTVGEEDGQHYFAMELVEGQTLAARLRQEGPLTVAETVEIILQVLAGLEKVHSAGLVHRDIKPSNIMIDNNRRAILMDFGLAKAATDQVLTAPGSIMGTPEYMPPEQVQGLEANPRSDLYSIGVVLFQMLAGWPPFTDKSDVKILKMHVDKPAPRLTEVASGVPLMFDAIVQRLMSKNPADRFQSVSELSRELAKFKDATDATATYAQAKPAPAPPAPPPRPSHSDLSIASTILSQKMDRTETAGPQAQAQQAKPGKLYRDMVLYFIAGVLLCVLLLLMALFLIKRFKGRRPPPAPPPPSVIVSLRDGREFQGRLISHKDRILTLELGEGQPTMQISESDLESYGPVR